MNNFQKQIWQNNYKAPGDKTIEDTFRRVSNIIADVEQDEQSKQILQEQFFKIMSQWKFIPGGRILANAGVTQRNKATLYNCYVYHPYDFGIRDIDSMQGIFESLKKSAKILASQGGLGISATYIRPNGSFINGTGVRTPGVLKFLQLWDKASQVITMGSSKTINDNNKGKKKIRKGAMLCSLDCSHPQIKEFVTIKQKSNKLTKFNLSVLVSDRFMNSVQKNEIWKLQFPKTDSEIYKNEWDGDLQKWIVSGKPTIIYEELPARELWDLIMMSTYNRNQPGILFYDTINEYNPVSYCQRILTTNPCLSGDTLVAVADGRNAVSIKQLAQQNKEFDVYSVNQGNKVIIERAIAFKTKENAQLIQIHFDDDSSLKCTPDHLIMLRNGNYKKAIDLKQGQSLMPFNSYISNKRYRQISSNVCRDRRQYRMIAQYNNLIVDPKTTAIHHQDFNSYNDNISNLKSMTHQQHKYLHSQLMKGKNNPMNKWYKNASKQQKKRYHDNMSKALSGKNNKNYSGKTKQDIYNFVKTLIQNKKRNISKAEYQKSAKINGFPMTFSSFRKKQFDCDFMGLIKKITINEGYKYYNSVQLRKLTLYNHKVKSIVRLKNRQNVYDLNVQNTHNFGVITSYSDKKFIQSSGIFVHNCGQIPQPSNVCNLGSLNLPMFYHNGQFDFQEFQQTVKYAVCFLDNVCNISYIPLQEYYQQVDQKRRIGLGVMGLGSLLMMMGMKFGSNDAQYFVDKLFKIKAQTELITSAFLGKIKGSFKSFDKQRYFSSKWWYEIPISYEIKKEIQKIGCMRNSVHSSNQPTGNCIRKNTKIITDHGAKTIKQIFLQNQIKLNKNINTSYIPIKTIYVNTLDGYKRIIGLYNNNKEEILCLETQNKNVIQGTKEHKVLVKAGDNTAEWKSLNDIQIGEKILLKKLPNE